MITVEIVRQNNYITSIKSSGHSNTVICASVSTILSIIGLYVQTKNLGNIEEQEYGLMKVNIEYKGKKKRSEIAEILTACILLLNEIKKEHPNELRLIQNII